MELRYHALALGGGIILGIIAAFVTKSFIVGLILPVGIYVCAILWGKVNSIQKEEGLTNDVSEPKDGEITQQAATDQTVPPVQ